MGMPEDVRAVQRRMWALGDYPRIAAEILSDLGETLVSACDIGPRQRVLDVGAGPGTAAIPAAEAGATVVASDLTPELFEAGRRAAAARAVEITWVEADAEALPFDDGEFDVVMSCLGVMFAPDHQRAADELVRVCRPGGTIGLLNWTPDGTVGEFFAVFAPYAPPALPHAQSPVLWGSEDHLQRLFGDRVRLRTRTGRLTVGHFDAPDELVDYYKENFGPTIATYAHVAHDPERTAALDRAFLDYAYRTNVGPPEGPASFRFDYLLAVGERL